MSRGLGRLQREVLDALEPSATTELNYLGSFGSRFWMMHKPRWVSIDGFRVELGPGVYDLRAVSKYMQVQHGRHRGWSGAEEAALSRAVRTLVRRGEITILSLLPITDYDMHETAKGVIGRVQRLRDGDYLPLNYRQRRFACRGSEPLTHEAISVMESIANAYRMAQLEHEAHIYELRRIGLTDDEVEAQLAVEAENVDSDDISEAVT